VRCLFTYWQGNQFLSISYVTVLVLSVKHNYYNLLVSLFVYLATCFGHLFGHIQAILWVCTFYLHYYIYNTLISILQTRPVIRDLLFCSTGKLLVRVGSLQFFGPVVFLFFFIRHYEWLSVYWYWFLLLLSVCLVVYLFDRWRAVFRICGASACGQVLIPLFVFVLYSICLDYGYIIYIGGY
jgi:hypothetical protein